MPHLFFADTQFRACIGTLLRTKHAAMNTNLLSAIDAFLAEHSMTEHRFGLLAAHNGRLLERLRSGGRVWPETEAMIREFIIKNSDRTRRTSKAA
jgi:hypothetical protein